MTAVAPKQTFGFWKTWLFLDPLRMHSGRLSLAAPVAMTGTRAAMAALNMQNSSQKVPMSQKLATIGMWLVPRAVLYAVAQNMQLPPGRAAVAALATPELLAEWTRYNVPWVKAKLELAGRTERSVNVDHVFSWGVVYESDPSQRG